MAIAVSTLDAGSATPVATNFDTGSITPSAWAWVILDLVVGNPVVPTPAFTDLTVTGNGLSWTCISAYVTTAGVWTHMHWLAQGASPTTGVINVDGIATSNNVLWKVSEFTGARHGLSSPNAVANGVNTGGGTSASATLPSSRTTGSGVYASLMFSNFGAVTWGGGVSTFGSQQVSLVNGTVGYAYGDPGSTTPSATMASGNSWSMLAMEVLLFTAGGLFLPSRLNGTSTGGPFFANQLG